MIAISTIILLFVLFICNGRATFYEKCSNDTNNFATKVENSSFVVYGKPTAKTLDETNDSMFYVTFQVDCIFKGPAISRHINITHAGQVQGKKYCQDFPIGRGYTIAFLERNPLNASDTKTFIPADFVEMPFKTNVTNKLLANTCGLHQVLPLESLASITDVCPAVSTDHQCIVNKIHHELTSNSSSLNPVVIPGGTQNGIEYIHSKSGIIQVEVDKKSGVNSINISILLILMAIVFVRFN